MNDLEKEIIEFYKNNGLKPTGKNFKIGPRRIKKILINNNIELHKKGNLGLSESERDLCLNAYINEKLNIKQIHKKYKFKESTISSILKLNNIPIHNHKKYFINESWLDIIDCQEKAYFLGFFYADGNCSSKYNRVSIKLSSKDEYILKQFNSFFSKENLISHLSRKRYENSAMRNYTIFMFNNKHIHNRLVDLGCFPKKSLTLVFPNNLEKELNNFFWAFVRGLIDGDGCLHIKKSGGITIFLCSTLDFNKKLQEILLLNNINSRLVQHGKIYRLYIDQQNSAKRLLDLIYNNSSIHLIRKYEKYILFLEYMKNVNQNRLEK